MLFDFLLEWPHLSVISGSWESKLLIGKIDKERCWVSSAIDHFLEMCTFEFDNIKNVEKKMMVTKENYTRLDYQDQ
ncbi:hypothetical protein [Pseudozobellia sp. WGM2]|uniref:hypothetical protein n=1 Tax=Pseudozobellia sp. WGM2 TaxID=2787625 RepID=UPI001AE04EC8|nr:hypothetical protein [Pseudozobellia sp. WGM2]